MISLVVYGRNDDYGYNYQKKVVLFLNVWSEIVSEIGGEIVFVDYASPIERPTVVETIADCLTKKAIDVTKVIRVWPKIYDLHNTKRLVNEAFARNIGAAFSTGDCPWILFTNTDVLCLYESAIAELQAALNFGESYLALPRYELPEFVWDSVRRTDPADIKRILKEYSDINAAKYFATSQSCHLFDSPGDFQLLRKTVFEEVGGFDETMELGWHLDSNIAKRISLRGYKIAELKCGLSIFHCEHTRHTSRMHGNATPQNSYAEYVNEVTSWHPKTVSHDWKAEKYNNIISVVPNILPSTDLKVWTKPSLVAPFAYTQESYPQNGYERDVARIYLYEILKKRTPSQRILYLADEAYVDWKYLFPLLSVERFTSAAELSHVSFSDVAYVIFDFWSGPMQSLSMSVVEAFVDFCNLRDKELDAASTTIVGLGAVHNSIEKLFLGRVSCVVSPPVIPFRYGHIKGESILSRISLGALAQREIDGRISLRGLMGLISYGPYEYFTPAQYLLKIVFKQSRWSALSLLPTLVRIEIRCGGISLTRKMHFIWGQINTIAIVRFDIHADITIDDVLEVVLHGLNVQFFDLIDLSIDKLEGER